MEWTIRSVLAWATDYLNEKGAGSARLDAELLLCVSLELRRIDLYMDMERPLLSAELAAYRELLKRRAELEPIAYILGEKEFYGHTFGVRPGVLIPRPETELLVEQALKLAPKAGRVLELGSGSGAVICSILLERPDLSAAAGDISWDAIRITGENRQRHGLESRLGLFNGDLLKAVRAEFDLIIMNPPYIREHDSAMLSRDVADYEPLQALYGGESGFDVIERLLKDVSRCLKPGGRLLMEMGFDQQAQVERLIEAQPELRARQWLKDLAGHDRAVVVEKNFG